MKENSLTGHVALVTGSSKGLGAGVARSLADAGAKVVINAFNNIARSEEIAREIIANGGEAIAIRADVSKESEVRSLIEQVGNELGPVDILVPNATPAQLKALTQFGYNVGLAFQIIDDILDVTQTSEKLGKSAGKDLTAEKSTFPALMGLEASRARAKELTEAAHSALELFGPHADRLRQLAAYLLSRAY